MGEELKQEISDTPLVAQPVSKKLKQKSLLAAERHRFFSWPLRTLEEIHWMVLTGGQLNA